MEAISDAYKFKFNFESGSNKSNQGYEIETGV